MKQVFTLLLFLSITSAYTQITTTFENFELEAESFLNGSDLQGGFATQNIFLPNVYFEAYDSWSGWSISNTTDVTTPDFTNQYSSISGSGDESEQYAVAYLFGANTLVLTGEAAGEVVTSMSVNNSTYAYLTVRDGNTISKKFGGIDGNDPDFFLLTIQKYLNGTLGDETIEFYLADYRFDDNSMDYIVDEWTDIDLTSLGAADSLSFTLSSTDNGMFGMNTPAYFVMDNFVSAGTPTSTKIEEPLNIYIAPNPASSYTAISYEGSDAELLIYDLNGRLVLSQDSYESEISIDLSTLSSGIYAVLLKNNSKISRKKLIIR